MGFFSTLLGHDSAWYLSNMLIPNCRLYFLLACVFLALSQPCGLADVSKSKEPKSNLTALPVDSINALGLQVFKKSKNDNTRSTDRCSVSH